EDRHERRRGVGEDVADAVDADRVPDQHEHTRRGARDRAGQGAERPGLWERRLFDPPRGDARPGGDEPGEEGRGGDQQARERDLRADEVANLEALDHPDERQVDDDHRADQTRAERPTDDRRPAHLQTFSASPVPRIPPGRKIRTRTRIEKAITSWSWSGEG